MDQAPTDNERVLAGALIVMLCTKAMDSPGHGTEVKTAGFISGEMNLIKISHVGYQMMGVSNPESFMRTGESYSKVLAPAIEALYDKFAIVEKVMDS